MVVWWSTDCCLHHPSTPRADHMNTKFAYRTRVRSLLSLPYSVHACDWFLCLEFFSYSSHSCSQVMIASLFHLSSAPPTCKCHWTVGGRESEWGKERERVRKKDGNSVAIAHWCHLHVSMRALAHRPLSPRDIAHTTHTHLLVNIYTHISRRQTRSNYIYTRYFFSSPSLLVGVCVCVCV